MWGPVHGVLFKWRVRRATGCVLLEGEADTWLYAAACRVTVEEGIGPGPSFDD